jgi:cytochrome c oxidase assembly protein subunit 15
MSLHAATAPTADPAAPPARGRRAVRAWLWLITLMVFAMVVVGGATRLTESGLSITEWQPIHGVVPPLDEAEWLEEFAKYQTIPEFQLRPDMTLGEFKTIFWWEWSHRLLGRAIGFVFFVPFVIFAARGFIPRARIPGLALLFVLGGLQGAVGWWMVASGLVERTDVSQYRLATHLTLACVILVSSVWMAESFGRYRPHFAERRGLLRGARILVGLVLVQIFLGGLVAGLNAGLIYNDWPLMQGEVFPSNGFALTPWWRNFFEEFATVQFVHRMFAYALMAVALWHFLAARRNALNAETVRRAGLVLLLVLLQAAVGVLTLVNMVPIGLGLAHQALAAIVLVAATVHAHRLTAARGPSGGVAFA